MSATPLEIAEALAECHAPISDETGDCVFCEALAGYGSKSLDLPDNHMPACPWRMAKEWWEATLNGTA